MLVNTQNFSVRRFAPSSSGLAFFTSAIWSVNVRSCNVRTLVIRGPFMSGLAFSVDPTQFLTML